MTIILFYYQSWLLRTLGFIPCNTIKGVAGGGASGAAAPDSWNQGGWTECYNWKTCDF